MSEKMDLPDCISHLNKLWICLLCLRSRSIPINKFVKAFGPELVSTLIYLSTEATSTDFAYCAIRFIHSSKIAVDQDFICTGAAKKIIWAPLM